MTQQNTNGLSPDDPEFWMEPSSNEQKGSKPPPVSKRKWLDRAIIFSIIGLVAFAAFLQARSDSQSLEGQKVSEIRAMAVSNQAFEWTPGADSEVLVLDFWATWCGACISQMPAIETVKNDPDTSALIVSVNIDDTAEAVQQFMERNGYSFEVLMDDGSLARRFRANRIPLLVVISPDGLVSYARSGVVSEVRLRELIRDAGARE